MSDSSSAIEIIATASKLLKDICDVPVLSPLKPLGNIAVTICEHAGAVNENKEAAIVLAKRVNRTVHTLINSAPDFKGPMPGNYMDGIKRLEDVLEKISIALQKMGRSRWSRRFLPGTTASQLRDLSSELDLEIQLFGLSADIEARQTSQTVRSIVSGKLRSPISSEPNDHAIVLSALQTDEVLHTTHKYSVQIGSYRSQSVVVLKYFKPEPNEESIFAQDQSQRLDQTHPFILRVFLSCKKARIILLLAEDLIFCTQNMGDLDDIRRPWQEQKIGEAISPIDLDTRPFSRTSPQYFQVSFGSLPFLTIKESAALLKQFLEVATFLKRNKVEVAWWQFKPSWVGLRRGNNKMVLFDWAQDAELSKADPEFDPGYAIHLMGLGFSPMIPGAFQDSIREGPKQDRDALPREREPQHHEEGASWRDQPRAQRLHRIKEEPQWEHYVPPHQEYSPTADHSRAQHLAEIEAQQSGGISSTSSMMSPEGQQPPPLMLRLRHTWHQYPPPTAGERVTRTQADRTYVYPSS